MSRRPSLAEKIGMHLLHMTGRTVPDAGPMPHRREEDAPRPYTETCHLCGKTGPFSEIIFAAATRPAVCAACWPAFCASAPKATPAPDGPWTRRADPPAMMIENGRVAIYAEQFEIVPGDSASLRDDPVKLLVRNAILSRENRYLRTEIATLRLRLEDRTYE
ncbi:hypothetical protein [Haematobacter massiliensis]|uniref:hypothetical protein n=1 Tax=Haematobacter massiliensis TaxID=195105 RepID=UPI0023F2ECE2|nr:hypothetical protein [Haematobacter massiliensis]